MRILLSANAPNTTTGYGTQAKGMIKAFQSLGHEVGLAAFWGVQGGMLNLDGVPIYCNLRDNWGQDVIAHHVKHFAADVVLTLHDLWVLDNGYQDKAGVPHIAYFPVDSVPAAPRTVTLAKQARYPVTYSKFGYEEMLKAGVRTTYLPHAVDTSVFRPGDKAEARRLLGVPPDSFMCSMVAANKGYPSRKAFPEQLMAFAEFRKSHKDAILFLHTQRKPIGYWADGIDFDSLIPALGLEDCVFFSNEYLSSQNIFDERGVATIYQASDVLLAASYAEGFGLPIVEAQACGCPVITTNFSSMPELTFNGICTERGQPYWSLLGCWQQVSSIENITKALAAIYTGYYRSMSAVTSADVIASEYSWPIVTKQWKVFLDVVAAEIDDMKAMGAVGD